MAATEEKSLFPFAEELVATANAICTSGKGILAADESTGTIGKRLATIGLENTTDNSRTYRQLLFTTDNLEEHCSGIILFEETLFQNHTDGTPFVKLIQDKGIIPGIKVDKGTRVMPFTPGQKYTQGLTDLDVRCERYYNQGARFAKWRAVLAVIDGDIDPAHITETAWTLARYAAICQSKGLVPIIEPEILMDGDHSLACNEKMTTKVLSAVYKACIDQNVLLEGTILKPNMVLQGKQCKDAATFVANGAATVRALQRTLPAAVPGVTFLSGGQTEEEATMNLNSINAPEHKRPWNLSFSFGRALQASVLKAWMGKEENVAAAQDMLRLRLRANGMANQGKYDGFAATEEAKKTLYEMNYTY